MVHKQQFNYLKQKFANHPPQKKNTLKTTRHYLNVVQVSINADTVTVYQPLKLEITVMLLQKYSCNI